MKHPYYLWIAVVVIQPQCISLWEVITSVGAT